MSESDRQGARRAAVATVPVHYHLFAVLLPLCLLVLCLTQKWHDDGKYSLAPFQYVVFFLPEYFHDPPTGPLQPYAPRGELGGWADLLDSRGPPRRWLYNMGGLKVTVAIQDIV